MAVLNYSINLICQMFTFRFVVAKSKNFVWAISGNDICRADRGGYSIVATLLTIVRGSQSPSKAQA